MTEWNGRLGALETALGGIARDHAPAALASSFSLEDMVLTDVICRNDLDIEIFTLDTGRLPEETHRLIAEAGERYGRRIRVLFPDARAVEEFVARGGPNAFYDSVEDRMTCCRIRKVEPLRRALAGKAAWITGLRREQAPTRNALAEAEWDADNGLHKFNPLATWSGEDVRAHIREFDVPYNALFDAGYASIGCAPCSRAIKAGEDLRAGRWWWENPDSKECGLHVRKRVA